jgi:APA family basic amino acid/polyamine antiporter
MENKLNKKFGLITATSMVVGIVIGSGIFFKAQTILKITNGNMPLGILAWIIGGLIMIICSYAFSILARKYTKVNGLVDYAEATCGEKYAYILGWFITSIYIPCITSVLAWVSARYTLVIFGLNDPTTGLCLALSALYLIICYTINSLSPIIAGKIQITATVLKLIPIVLMAVVGTIYGLIVKSSDAATTSILVSNFNTIGNSGISSLFGAIVATAFAYEGWIIATTINSEIEDEKKNLPKALILGSIIVVVAYIAYYIGVAGGASVESLIEDGATTAFKNVFGNVCGTILNVLIAVSCLGTLNGLMIGNIRNMYSLAARGQGIKPEIFKEVDKETNMPTNSGIIGLMFCAIWLFYFYIANLDTVLVGTYAQESANGLIRLLGTLNPETGVYTVGWFAFDSSEIPIVALYAMYIPIFAKMFSLTELSKVKRIVVPTLAIISSLFMVVAAIYAHKWGVLYFLIIAAIIMGIGKKFYRADVKE